MSAVLHPPAPLVCRTGSVPPAEGELSARGRWRYRNIRDFLQRHVYVTDGPSFGQPLKLLPEQDDFLRGVYGRLRPDGGLITRTAIHSCGRKNGKTAFNSGLLQAHIYGPEAKPNSQVYSAARSRDQAALIFDYAAKSIRMNPHLEGLVHIQDSYKTIRGLITGATFKALSAEAKTAHGLNPALILHDELGQVVGPIDPFFDALETAFGAQAEPLSIILSTQAATDADLMSKIIDDAISSGDETIFAQVFQVPREADIWLEENWYLANYALGKYRSLAEMRSMAAKAKRMPETEMRFRNLYLNQRVSAMANLIAPDVWRENAHTAPDDWFQRYPVHIGLDLSSRTDLTAAVIAVYDPISGAVGLRVYAYAPMQGLEERALHDRIPYPLWVKDGHLILTPGRVVDYAFVIDHLKSVTAGMEVVSLQYDRWRITEFVRHADVAGFGDGTEWVPVGQGYKDMSPRVESLEHLALNGKLWHGGNPVLTYAAMGCTAVSDPAGNRKLEKSKSSARIDAMVAAVMASYAAARDAADGGEYDISFM